MGREEERPTAAPETARECRRLEEELRGARGLVQAAFDALPARLCLIDERGLVVAVNRPWLDYVNEGLVECRLVGQGADYLATCDRAASEGDESAARAAEGIRAVLRGEAGEFTMDYPCDSPGSRRHFQMRAVPFVDAAGRHGALIAHQDVTGIKLAEEESSAALYEARELARFKEEFISGITHDLKTPLVPIRGFLEMVLSGRAGPLTDRQRLFLTYCQAAAARQANMIDDLLASSRIQARHVRFEPRPLDLREVLHRAAQFLELIAHEKRLTIELDLYASPLPVTGEAGKLERVFNNLFSNAVRYNVSEGKVVVRARAEEASVVVSVRDTGAGIEAGEQEKIFAPYYQRPGSRGGSGIGLSSVAEFVRLHGGHVEVDSAPGEGSTFTVILPRAEGRIDSPHL